MSTDKDSESGSSRPEVKEKAAAASKESPPVTDIFEKIFNATRDAIILIDPDGVINLWNKAAEDLFGYTKTEALGKRVHELLAPKDFHHTASQGMTIFKETGTGPVVGKTLALTAVHKTGRPFPIELSLSTLDMDGKPGIVGTVRDITEQRKSREELNELNLFNEQIIAHTQGIVVYDRDLIYRVWNPFMEQITGIPASQVLGRHPRDVFPFLQDAGVIDRLHTALKGEETASVEFPYHITQTGNSGWTLDISVPLKNEKGEITGVLGTVQNITQRKEAEKALKNNMKMFEALLEHSFDSTVLVDATGKAVYVSPSTEKTSGFSAEEIAGRSGFEFIHPEDIPIVMETFLTGLQEPGAVRTAKYRTMHKDGHWVHCEAIAHNMLHDPEVNGIILNVRDISERVKAEDTLRQSEINWKNTFDASKDIITLISHDHIFQNVNRAACRALGKTAEEIVGRKCYEIVHGTNSPIAGCPCHKTIDKGQEGEAEIEEHGGVFQVTAAPVFDDTGKLKSFVHTVRDITQRKKMEEELRSSKEKYEKLFQSSRDSLMTLEPPTWLFTSGNSATCKLFGAKDEAEFISFAPWQLSPKTQPDGSPSGEKAREMIETAMKEGSNFFEWTHKRLNGEEFPATVLLTRMEIDGEFLIHATVRDITESKLAEAALLASESKYKLVVENLNEGVWQIDKDGFTSFTNGRMAQILGYTAEEMEGKHLFDFMDEQGKAIAAEKLEERKKGVREDHYFEFIKKGGTRIYAMVITSPLLDGEGNYMGAVAGIQDVTDRKFAEKTLREAERMATIGEVAAGMAHDFNNLIQHILGCIELALMDKKLSNETEEDLLSSKQALLDTAGRLKDLMRFAGKSREVKKFGIIDVKTIINDTIMQTKGLWKDEAQSRGLTIEVITHCQENLTFLGDSGEMRSVLFNIIKNSVEAMPDGGTISIGAKMIDDEICLTIADTGTGMDENTRKRVFDPFYSTKGFERGRGFGMNNVFTIIREHKGTIRVTDTKPGKGTTFEIRLPITANKPVSQMPEANVEKTIPARVLWVDDEEMISRVGKRILKSRAHEVDTAGSGYEAIALLAKNEYDLMITDVGMPGMSGYQLVEKIKGKYPDMMIAVLTGWGDNMTEAEKRDRGIGCIVGKPIEATQVLNLVQEVMQMKRK